MARRKAALTDAEYIDALQVYEVAKDEFHQARRDVENCEVCGGVLFHPGTGGVCKCGCLLAWVGASRTLFLAADRVERGYEIEDPWFHVREQPTADPATDEQMARAKQVIAKMEQGMWQKEEAL